MCVNPKSVPFAKTHLFGNAFPSRLPNTGRRASNRCPEEPQANAVEITFGSGKFEFQSDCTRTCWDLRKCAPGLSTAVPSLDRLAELAEI